MQCEINSVPMLTVPYFNRTPAISNASPALSVYHGNRVFGSQLPAPFHASIMSLVICHELVCIIPSNPKFAPNTFQPSIVNNRSKPTPVRTSAVVSTMRTSFGFNSRPPLLGVVAAASATLAVVVGVSNPNYVAPASGRYAVASSCAVGHRNRLSGCWAAYSLAGACCLPSLL